MDCDLIVIGSGFGGAVAAMRAAEAGLRVLVLERGPLLDDAAFAGMARGRAPLLHRPGGRGPIELRACRGFLTITSSAVGGGSHVYTAVTVPAPDEVFQEDWPESLRAATLAPCYRRVSDVIAPTTIPRLLPRTSAVHALASRLGTTGTSLPVAIDWPADSSAMLPAPARRSWRSHVCDALRGGPVTVKRTLDRTYLARARRAGATIRPLHEADCIAPDRGGYAVRCRVFGQAPSAQRWFHAPRVVLAAGTLGTVTLLLRCRDRFRSLPRLSAALGHRFFTNGDFGALLVGPRLSIGPDSGPPVTGWLDLWKTDRLYLMEIGGLSIASEILGTVLRLSPNRQDAHGRRAPFAWVFGVMGFERRPGRLSLNSSGALVHNCDGTRDDDFHRARAMRLRALADAAGARLVAPPERIAATRALTVHPLGGAALADDPLRGVTDARGRVYHYPGLYIADGALLPTPTGGPPSMTIAALAEHVMDGLLHEQ